MLSRFSEPILAPALEQMLQQTRLSISGEARDALIPVFLPLAQRCWWGKQRVIRTTDLVAHLETAELSPTVRTEFQALLR